MIDLSPFCSKGRLALMSPMSFGQYVYATNGHIAVRVPLFGEFEQAFYAMGKALDEYFLAPTGPFVSVDCPDIPLLPPQPEKPVCPECGGDGITVCDECGHESACNACDGKGHTYKGPEVPDQHSVSIFGNPIDAEYARLIGGLPGIMISPTIGNLGIIPVLYFRFDDGGEGLVAIIRNPYTLHHDINIGGKS